MPEGEIHIPTLYPLKTLDQVVDVDYYMPGCPPESHQIAAVIDLVIQALQGKAELPPKGAFIGVGKSTVCDECMALPAEPAVADATRTWHLVRPAPLRRWVATICGSRRRHGRHRWRHGRCRCRSMRAHASAGAMPAATAACRSTAPIRGLVSRRQGICCILDRRSPTSVTWCWDCAGQRSNDVACTDRERPARLPATARPSRHARME